MKFLVCNTGNRMSVVTWVNLERDKWLDLFRLFRNEEVFTCMPRTMLGQAQELRSASRRRKVVQANVKILPGHEH